MIEGVESIADPTRYLNVTRLDLRNIHALTTAHYTSSFPNLKELRIADATQFDPSVIEAAGETTLADLRSTNIAQQRMHGTWPSLDLYSGPLHILYMLGLDCRIPKIELDVSFKDPSSYLDAAMLDVCLSSARPSHLTLRAQGGYCLLDPRSLAALCQTAPRQTAVLVLRFTFWYCPSALPVQDGQLCFTQIMSMIHDVLDTSSISVLILELDWSWKSTVIPDAFYDEWAPGQAISMEEGVRHHASSTSVYADGRPLPTFADDLLSAHSALKTVIMSVRARNKLPPQILRRGSAFDTSTS
ncbi:hypothetical protein C8Q80DRAFT_1144074 [Daedaleopsis nitida]|nr:hypothetical protein C8Q80DRAFT_1144074 [Daedaleopsis nitida]